jgi:hypothetical protein
MSAFKLYSIWILETRMRSVWLVALIDERKNCSWLGKIKYEYEFDVCCQLGGTSD